MKTIILVFGLMASNYSYSQTLPSCNTAINLLINKGQVADWFNTDMSDLFSSAGQVLYYYDGAAYAILRFKNGGTYIYCGVPESIFQGLKEAALSRQLSAGEFYNTRFKQYACNCQ